MRVPRPPVLYHFFKAPVPYVETLALQEKIHQMQLRVRKAASESSQSSTAHPDVLLLLAMRNPIGGEPVRGFELGIAVLVSLAPPPLPSLD